MILIRQATALDGGDIARIHVETWRHAYKGIVPEVYLGDLSVAKRSEFWTKELAKPSTSALVAIDDSGRAIGWASFGPSRDDDVAGFGELYAIYLQSDEWGKGYGKTLLTAAEGALRRTDFSVVTLWVLERNSRTRRFYEKAGYAVDGASKVLDIGGRNLVELRYKKAGI